MKRTLLAVLLVGTLVNMVQAQSCDEALLYAVPSLLSGEPAQWMARTLCDGESDPMPLAESFREQNIGIDSWFAPDHMLAYGFGSISILSEANPTPQVVLAETENAYFHNPLWSPDGTQLAVIETHQEGDGEWLIITDLEGESRRLTQLISSAQTGLVITPVLWSPDGNWISYALSQSVDDENWDANIQLLSTACIADPAQPCEAHSLEITDESGERPSIQTDSGTLFPEHWWGATWSPDSQRLAFVCGNHLCFLNGDGSDFSRSDVEFHGHSLAWSPSGESIAYFADGDIYVYDIENDEHRNVTQTPDVQEFLPTWITLPEGAFLFAES